MDTPTELSPLEAVHQLVQQTLSHNYTLVTSVLTNYTCHLFVPYIDILCSGHKIMYAGHYKKKNVDPESGLAKLYGKI